MISVSFTETQVKNGQSPQYSCDETGPSSVHYYQFSWADLAQAEYEIMGYTLCGGSGDLLFTRLLPDEDPLRPGLWAARVSFAEGRGSSGYESVAISGGYTRKVPKYKKGVLRVDYSWRPYYLYADDEIDFEYDRYVEIEENGTTDYVTPPPLKAMPKWVGGGVTVNQTTAVGATYGKLIPYSNVSMTWHQVPFECFPRAAILNSYGKVSSADLGVSGDNNYYQSATLLFCGARWRRTAMSFSASPCVDLTYYFRHDTGQNPDQAAQRGPNTFICFLEEPYVRRLISSSGLDPGIGSRSGKCVYEEFNPNDLFTPA